ncbi:alpha/beta hydrolase [Streptococcus pneumoniae]|uniref:alpha/beta hydrolase n=1 Tax=Streptococcus pneumoniae TaxID=1313 RepID=UPI0005DE12D2|nr:alpha/beta hydrolase [Streptococcus pneumoniae]MDG8483547.1 alpha/beta hydrolase [Streptococcus pneumoniae]MDG9058604.1 alpha/beta hydrolase [Streptococcus pneumoniae]CEV68982.1 alpha/beta hydrolase related protein [Streptococcus pneumoniae]CEX36386.1 alpha/beta hydrolase related protein [Streptococcus pneumoniae]CEX99084.1 alpha/beta hydrolase related protein [Streptococcus pneumoniae]
MKKYFISGLGNNAYHSKDFFQELDSQVYFLNPYEKYLLDETKLKSWFKNEIVEEESICLIGHSLGGDLARYLASEFEEVKKLILLDGGYLDLDKILPLDTELEETKNYIKSQIISDLDVLTSKEKSEAKHWSENMEKAVRQSYHWNVEYNRYELAINYENIEAILRLRRKIQAFKREVGDTLFISPRYPNGATWREEALKELPDYFDTIFLENFGHELYTQAPKEIASLMNEWLAYFL